MAAIRKLSQEIIGRIAAGEVVERPASVVKEMVENAIDAGAAHITVEVRGGGVEYLRITDDGKGIPAEEIRMTFERHATSKLQTAEQLFDIHTLGFRGEALASVAAVAKVTCTTKTADAPLGIRAKIEGGEFVDIRQAASPVGTTFVVEDLFYNTPVRRKFLKKPAQEASLVSDYLLRLMLSHPEIAFRFVNQGKTIYQSIGDGKVESVLYRVYGKDAFSQMHHVSGNMNGLILEGYVGVGELSRGNRQQQSFFINGRYFRSGLISRALESGCEGRVMVGRFPMCALFLKLPYQLVDVNVHPNKLEVRFQNEKGIAEAVKTLVNEALHEQSLGAQLNAGTVAPAQPHGLQVEESQSSGGFTMVALGEGKDTPAIPASKPSVEKQPAIPETTASPQKENDTTKPVKDSEETSKPVSKEQVRQLYTDFAPDFSALPIDGSVMRESSSQEVTRIMMELSRRQAAEKTAQKPESSAEARPAEEKVVPKAKATIPTNDRFAEPYKPVATELVSSTSGPAQKVEVPQKAPTIATTSPDIAPKPSQQQTTLLPEASPADQLRLIGIAFSTYWIFESGDKLLLLDQHAAHERMLYDKMMQQFEGTAISQQLLTPVLVEMTQHDLMLLDELQDVLTDAGFDVQRFDDTSAAIHAIPTLFGHNENPRTLFLEALDEWQAGRGAVTRERMRRQIAQMACKRAIKAGDKLSEDEVKGFLAELLQSDSMPTCPHGRPIVIEMTQYMLEKRFKRIQ